MADIYTSVELLDSIKTRALIPSSQTTYTDSDLLKLANEELKTFTSALLMRTHEEYLVVEEEIPLVANQSKYRIPTRALGGKLRDLAYIDSSGNEQPMSRIEREDEHEFGSISDSTPRAFYIEGNYIVIVPALNSNVSGSLNAVYYQRPNKIVEPDRYKQITAVGSNSVTISSLPGVFTASETYDLISQLSGSETLEKDLVVSSIVGMVITFTSTISNVAVGDYICIKQESPFPQCPEELHPVLAQRVAVRVLESLNDAQGLAIARKTLEEMETNILTIVDNRIVSKPHKVVNKNFRRNPFYGR